MSSLESCDRDSRAGKDGEVDQELYGDGLFVHAGEPCRDSGRAV